jgi:hypothetical protein
MITDTACVIELKQKKKKFNKPIYVGAKILDLSKLHMYSFWYDNLKPKYGNNIKLLYIDTDSFFIEVKTANIYHDMLTDPYPYDTSNYPKDNILYSESNKGVLGKFKDELRGIPLEGFVGIRSKCYSIISEDDVTKARAKGIKEYIARLISFDKYLDVLVGADKQHSITQRSIRSKYHNVYTIVQNKAGIRLGDNKRYNVDHIHTNALGHFENILIV